MELTDRELRVAAQVPLWTEQLLDLSFRNTLLNFPGRTTALDLVGADEASIADLLSAARTVRLSELFPTDEAFRTAREQARQLARRIRLYREEKGVDVGYVAVGVVVWSVADPSGIRRAYRAPTVLCPLSIRPRGATQENFDLVLTGPPEPNKVLSRTLRRQHGLPLDDATLSLEATPEALRQHVEGILRELAPGRLEGFAAEDCLAAGLFTYEKLPIVVDLENAESLLADHDIVAAIAGDLEAIARLASSEPRTESLDLDAISVDDEFLILDADSSQRSVINAVRAGSHALVQGPPGTGKSQTIANLIAALAAKGKSILFVAEKRAAIDAVVDQLRDADLTELVFDLHEAHERRNIALQIQKSLETARQVPEARGGQLLEQLTTRRHALVRYFRSLHDKHSPWNLSAYDAQEELATFPPRSSTDFRMAGSVLNGISDTTATQLEESLRRYVALGGLSLTPETTPWAGAQIETTDDVRHVVELLDSLTSQDLPDARRALGDLLSYTRLERPSSVHGWSRVFSLLRALADTLTRHAGGIFDEPLEELAGACGSGAWRHDHGLQMRLGDRRMLIRRARSLRTDGERSKRRIHQGLAAAVEQRTKWMELTKAASPVVPKDLDQVAAAYRALHDRLSELAAIFPTLDLLDLSDDEMAETVRRLDSDRQILYRLPELHALRRQLAGMGLERLLTELRERAVNDGDQAASAFRRAWLQSVLEEIRLRSPAYAAFQPEDHDRLVAEYRDFDKKSQRLSAARIRRLTAERLIDALNRHHDERALISREANKKSRHKPLRELVRGAPNILLAARPCWAMSPLIVSAAMPPVRLFDVVVFDEASQVRPADAISSIMRGTQLVVTGDEKQLPPTNFFQKELETGEAEDEGEDVSAISLQDYESILKVLSGLLPQHRLLWHYRSRDERLIAFSNEHIYRDLVTFPGVDTGRPITHVRLETGIALPNQGGSAEEVQCVAQLALNHAETTPDLTLGIITFGDKHAQRIEKAIWAELRERPELRVFFDRPEEAGWRGFFVKNVENVQGDERDAIILAVGYGRRSASGVSHNFGPLNKDGGERRLNVAVTRARRKLTVVSSFGAADLDPARLKKRGAQLLRSFLDYAKRGESALGEGSVDSIIELNPFERDVNTRLREAGLNPHPQYGVGGYRIDIALSHPDHPGQWVLAVETDGRTYHSGRSARDRDRLRQEHLERLGWRFHRIWSPAWFRDPETETEKVVAAWNQAVANPQPTMKSTHTSSSSSELFRRPKRRISFPNLGKRPSIEDYSLEELVAAVRSICSDGLLHDNTEIINEVMAALGFSRRGARIVARITEAIQATEQKGR